MKARIKFTKIGPIKFIGHLDLLRNFQRTFRKSGLPIAYSSGFNPHQIMSIGAPLSVGITSSGEYIDVKFTHEIDLNHAKALLNENLPLGIEVVDITALENGDDSAMALIDAAKYKVTSKKKGLVTDEIINKLMTQSNIIITKKTKKNRIKELDIKPGIFNISRPNEDTIILLLATGSQLNIKPEMVLKELLEKNDLEYNPYNFSIHREELYYMNDHNFIPLNQ